jgi:hypothetical protein
MLKLRVTFVSAILTLACAAATFMATALASPSTLCDPAVDCNDGNPCTLDTCESTTPPPPTITIFCADDAHQNPVLATTQDPGALLPTDGQWTEFLFTQSRPYAALFAAAGEASFGLPVMRCYAEGIQNGTYDVFGKLYTNDAGRDMRYFYRFSLGSAVESVDTVGGSGGTEQFTDYLLGRVTIVDGVINVYFQDALLTGTGYPFFGWASIRLEGVSDSASECVHTPTPGVACDDGDACTTSGTCDSAGVCIGGTAKSCDDGNPCTRDSCVPASGCVYEPTACSLVTSSSLCTFDRDDDLSGDQFRLVFTPDPAAPVTWKLNASNPGQFFDNVFYVGAGGTSVTLTVPYPFVTQGAVPIHIYDSATSAVSSGEICISPGHEAANSAAQISLANYTDTSGDGKIGMGDTATLTVQLPSLSTGFAYIGVHLDYGLKKVGSFKKDQANNAVDASTGLIKVPDKQVYAFTNSAVGGAAVVMSENVFKKSPGIAGLVVRNANGDPVLGTTVQIFGGGGRMLSSVRTDDDGWYFYPYKYTGKATSFTVRLPDFGLSQVVTMKSNAFVAVNFITP